MFSISLFCVVIFLKLKTEFDLLTLKLCYVCNIYTFTCVTEMNTSVFFKGLNPRTTDRNFFGTQERKIKDSSEPTKV